MAAYNFLPQFADAVRTGKKCQTIRARGKRKPPKVGDTLHLYTGMRTAFCNRLAVVPCTSVELISIGAASSTVSIPYGPPEGNQFWAKLDQVEVEALAQADGFSSSKEFFDFFLKVHGATFSGYLIKWEKEWS